MRTDLRRDEGGAALVEAALVLPVLLLVVLGIAEVSLYLWDLGLARKAAQLGARRAAVSAPVAVGPGLEPADSRDYWFGAAPGARCFPGAGERGPCPEFAVVCGAEFGCRCQGACRFTFAPARLAPILDAMRAVLPGLAAERVEVGYATNGLGYVARPGPASVDVTVRLVGLTHRTLFLRELFGVAAPLRASASLPSEDLASR